VIQRALHVQDALYEPSQGEKIFYTRCTIGGKVCELIIDRGSCTSIASTTLIDRLQLPMKVHPIPYSLQWLKQGSKAAVSR